MLDTTVVTGATGFAGGHLLDRLTDRAPLVAWYRPKGTPPDPHRHIEWRPVDLLDAADVRRAIDETAPTQVFHIAGAPLVTSSFTSVVPHLRTILDDAGRPMVFINWNTDMGDGWEWSNVEEYPGYLKYTSMAYRMAINEIFYSLTH